MADAIKMAAKIALIALVTGAIVAVFTGIVVPEIDLTTFITAIGKGKAIIYYYADWLVPILNLGIVILALRYLALPTLSLAMIAYKWLFKVNE